MQNNSAPKYPDAQLLLNKIVADFMKDQKRKRRWIWIKRSLIVLLLIILYFKWATYVDVDTQKRRKPHVGLVDLKGTLLDNENGSAENFAKGMASAYKSKGLKAMIIRINSPGGSPVQSDYMFNTIRYYRKIHPNIKVYAVCVDVCASGAYYAASAADEIYANESSMVGSIGVIYSGFGFVDTLQKLGVTRRLQTAGMNKASLDPFMPEKPEAKVKLQGMLDAVHQEFINKVKEGRGTRLKVDQETFSGALWVGKDALDRGLIDGFASAGQLARDTIGLDQVIEYTYKESVLERMSKGIGLAMANSVKSVILSTTKEDLMLLNPYE